MRVLLAALVVLVMGTAIAGLGMGEAPAEGMPAPSVTGIEAAARRIAAGGATVARGRALYAEQGCDSCHAIASIGAAGKLGPRLDALDEDADAVVESIIQPRADIAGGYPAELMPADYAQRMSADEIRALATFVAAAAGGTTRNSAPGRSRAERGAAPDGG